MLFFFTFPMKSFEYEDDVMFNIRPEMITEWVVEANEFTVIEINGDGWSVLHSDTKKAKTYKNWRDGTEDLMKTKALGQAGSGEQGSADKHW